jgi:cell wall-associated NlpC family hydrolase
MRLLAPLAAALLLAFAPVHARDWAVPAETGVVGVERAQLDPGYWIARLPQADRVVLDGTAIARQNARLYALDRSMHDLAALPASLPRATVSSWMERVSTPPRRALFDANGKPVPAATVNAFVANADLGGIDATRVTRYGLVVHRAPLRAFPTLQAVFSSADDHDIDRLQESALFPGDPVAVAHESRDGTWWFVVSPRYAAWIEKQYVAEGDRDAILAWGQRAPFLVVTGATARTVHTPENPAVSDVQLEMGVRVPVLADWPAMDELNGQLPAAAHVIELPVRGDDGRLSFAPALLPRSADVASDYLPLTEANIIRQAFKFLGERYGWGHSYNARDCSGFASEIYRSFGVLIPRNTSAQAVSPALNRLPFDKSDPYAQRLQSLREARPGDLVYMPGHVMMMIGHVDGEPFVIHDTSGMSWKPEGSDTLVRLHLNGVVVTPVVPMMTSATTPTIDRLSSIQRIRP